MLWLKEIQRNPEIAMDDAGAWKTELAREMKSIGLEVDMNKL